MNAAYKDPVKYKAANAKEQVLLRIPRIGTEASYHKNAQSIGWIRHLLSHHVGEDIDSEESGVWLLEELHRLLPKSFERVAARKGFTIPHARMPINRTAAMWQDAKVDYRQSILIGKHCQDYFNVGFLLRSRTSVVSRMGTCNPQWTRTRQTRRIVLSTGKNQLTSYSSTIYMM